MIIISVTSILYLPHLSYNIMSILPEGRVRDCFSPESIKKVHL